jgi:hypothetical protein
MMATKKDSKKYLNLRDSFHDKSLNQILDKILFKQKLNQDEVDYLEKYNDILKLEIKDYYYISKNLTSDLIKSLIEKKIKVICNLEDRNGRFDDEIINLEGNFEDNKSKIFLKRGETCYLEDRFLYNLFYKVEKKYYSLVVQDEYFEKIKVGNED